MQVDERQMLIWTDYNLQHYIHLTLGGSGGVVAFLCREDSGKPMKTTRFLCFQRLVGLENALPSTPLNVQYDLYFDDQPPEFGHRIATL